MAITRSVYTENNKGFKARKYPTLFDLIKRYAKQPRPYKVLIVEMGGESVMAQTMWPVEIMNTFTFGHFELSYKKVFAAAIVKQRSVMINGGIAVIVIEKLEVQDETPNNNI